MIADDSSVEAPAADDRARLPQRPFSQLKETVIDAGLCTRCGMCVGICPHGVLGIDERACPVLLGECVSCGFCSACCPGADVDYPALSRQVFDEEFDPENLQGHVENIYVAHPKNQQIRFAGASGGMVTGILDYLLTQGRIDGALVVAMDDSKPYISKGVLATTSQELCASAQSKYCATPSLAVLQEIRRSKGRFAVVALPCQVHALKKMALVDRGLAKKIHYILGLYCHCTNEVHGHVEAIEAFGIPLDEVAAFQFRGGGWPGGFCVIKKDGTEVRFHEKILIKDVMNVMFRLYGLKRCQLCVDALCDYADLSFGDFWAFDFAKDLAVHERCTLISQRTAAGRQIMDDIIQSGQFVVHTVPHSRNSKRILRMAEGKKTRSHVGLHHARSKGLPAPDYHYAIPTPSNRDKRKVFFFTLFQRIDSPIFRKLVLKMLFSPLGVLAYKINTLRKNFLIDYRT